MKCAWAKWHNPSKWQHIISDSTCTWDDIAINSVYFEQHVISYVQKSKFLGQHGDLGYVWQQDIGKKIWVNYK